MTAGMPSVVIVDDHDLFRAGVRTELDGRVEVRGEAGGVEAAETAILDAQPDVGCSHAGRRSDSSPSRSPTRRRTSSP
jgi:DNA-binding NarL/FixJ family response regulator